MSDFPLDWLRLRAPADLAARDAALARRFAAALPKTPRIVDLGSGSGANARALMPRIAGDQHWTLIDRDRDLLAAQEPEFMHWARRQGYPILAGGGRIELTAGASHWTVGNQPMNLAGDPAALDRIEADAVTAAAFFDLVSQGWIERFVATLARRRLPLLAVLTVDGTRAWQPTHAADPVVAAAFRRHQARDKGFGPALGGEAPGILEKILTSQGFRVSAAVSDWHLGGDDGMLLAALIAGEAQAAREATPAESAAINAWEMAREKAHIEGGLALTLGHRDILALPR
jgi:hypothetical protein